MTHFKSLTYRYALCSLVALLVGIFCSVMPVSAAKNNIESGTGSPQIPSRSLPWSHIFYVRNTNDIGTNSLRWAINEADPDDTIIFDPSLSGETITLTSGPLVIDKNLTIDGSDLDEKVIISGGNTFLVFYIAANVTVTLDSLSIQNGQGLYSGGINNQGTLNLLNSAVSDNNANFGGGIFNCGTLNMTSNSLTGNTADNQGGGIFNDQSSLCLGNLTMTNCQLSNNHAYANAGDGKLDGYGGGIYNKGTLTITNSALTENTSEDEGGGIYNNKGTLTITNSTISGNIAEIHGGGIYDTSESTLTITGSNFSENETHLGSGGGVYNQGTLTITNSTLSGNFGQSGGAFFNEGTLTIISCTLSGNNASVDSNGGGIYNKGTLKVIKSTLTENSAGAGGGICNTGKLTVNNSTLSSNIIRFGDGGGIINSGTLIVTNSTLNGNSGSLIGGIYNYEGTLNYANTIIANSTNYSDGSPIDDCYTFNGTIGTNVRNLVETGNCGVPYSTDDPMLGPLAKNGGPTKTHALLLGSPAIDAGSLAYCPATDQRGISRPQGTGCDIGAFEFVPEPPDPGVTIFIPVVLR